MCYHVHFIAFEIHADKEIYTSLIAFVLVPFFVLFSLFSMFVIVSCSGFLFLSQCPFLPYVRCLFVVCMHPTTVIITNGFWQFSHHCWNNALLYLFIFILFE
uniref:Uncharacterized protein n=1 Tax=Ditylum brightwellii TaxID=49249 RepID=A0A7S4WIB3_9STRA